MKPLKIMSFNIRHGEGMDGRIDLERIAELIKRESADFVGLQEVDKNMLRSNFIDQTAKLAEFIGYHYCYHPNVKIIKGRYGNGILSKYPISTSYKQSLTSSKEPRGAVVATINLGEFNFKFINTHLGLVEEERLREVEEIVRNIKPDDRAVLVGDFNAGPENPEVEKLVRRGMIDAFVSCKEQKLITDETTNKGYTFAYKEKDPNVRIDYIFTTKNIQPVGFKVIESYCSDHFPIIAELQIK